MPRPTPDTVQKAARKALEQEPKFIREDGSSVDSNEVPKNALGKLEGARKSFLNRLANQPDVAKRMSDAIDREDRKAAAEIARETPGFPKEMSIEVREVVADNFRIQFTGCLFGFCWDLVLTF